MSPPPPDDDPPMEGRERLLTALRRPGSRSQVTVGVLLAMLGFAAVVQLQANRTDDTYVGARQSDLIQLINQLSLASRRADDQIAQLERTRASLRNDTVSRRTAVQRAREEVNTLGILAGTVPAVGPGVRITVTDPKGSVGTDQVLNGIQELRDAGAEAMEINNSVRVIASAWVKDGANGGLVVDGRLLAPPYTIDVIGDPHTLATALNFRGGFVSGVDTVGGKVRIEETRDVQIASTDPASAPSFAVPDANQ